MRNISCSLPENREPWLLARAERVRQATEAVRRGKKLALFLYPHADTSTFRYRGYNVYQATRVSESWQLIYFFNDELDTLESLLPLASLMIYGRHEWEFWMDALTAKAHTYGLPVLYDIDDLVCDLQYLTLVTNTLNVPIRDEVNTDFWFAKFSRLEFAARQADGFISTNPFLGERLRERFGKPFQIIPNSLNREQLAVSADCAEQKKNIQMGELYTIGYFSGTPSHINDFKVVSSELCQLLADHMDMELLVVGFMEFPPSMDELMRAGRVRFVPLVDFLELQRLIAQVDVNIVPLVNNTFTNCKSELKYFEAAAVNTVTAATPTYTYSHSLRNGETGYLCRPGQWYECIDRLYREPEQAARMAELAHEECIARYSGANFLRQIEAAYDYFAN